jgi:hypothetical protein
VYISDVPLLTIVALPLSTRSFTQKYQMSMCLVRSPPDRPRASSAIQLKLSRNTITAGTLYPYTIPLKFRRNSPRLTELDSPASSASVELFVTMVYFADRQCTAPRPAITTQVLVCERPSTCTPYDASTKRCTLTPDAPGLSIRPMSRVALIYRIRRINLSTSSLSHLVTRVAK